MAGLIEIAEKARPRCPHCRASLDLSEFLGEIFERILATIAAGERVYIIGFGTFVARYVQGRRIRSFDGTERRTDGSRRIRFKASERAKARINQGRTREEPICEQHARGAENQGDEAVSEAEDAGGGSVRAGAKDRGRRRAKPGRD